MCVSVVLFDVFDAKSLRACVHVKNACLAGCNPTRGPLSISSVWARLAPPGANSQSVSHSVSLSVVQGRLHICLYESNGSGALLQLLLLLLLLLQDHCSTVRAEAASPSPGLQYQLPPLPTPTPIPIPAQKHKRLLWITTRA